MSIARALAAFCMSGRKRRRKRRTRGSGERGNGGDGVSLYDQDGFLKCSPERERILAGTIAREKRESRGSRETVNGFFETMR